MQTLSSDNQMNYKYFLTNAVSLLNATFNPFIWSDFKDYKAFNNCTNLTNLVIGNGITSISNIVFSSFPNLTNIVIGNGVTSILS